jgi:hypothetical protein
MNSAKNSDRLPLIRKQFHLLDSEDRILSSGSAKRKPDRRHYVFVPIFLDSPEKVKKEARSLQFPNGRTFRAHDKILLQAQETGISC